MNLNDLLTLYCEQQEATGYSTMSDHSRTKDGEYPQKVFTICIHFTTDFEQSRKPEFIHSSSEEEAITKLQKLTQLNKAIA
jgi:hypothetical protein